MRRRLPLLLLVPVLLGAFAFHAYRAAHPTTAYQSADERSYGKLAVNLAEQHHYGDRSTKMRDPLHWPPGAPMLFAAGQDVFPSPASVRTFDIPAAYWLQAIVSLGSVLAAFALASVLAGAWAGLAAAVLAGFYPPLILATGEQLSEPLGAFFVVAAFLALAIAVRRRSWWAFGLTGLVLGLAVLTRADLLLAPFAVAGLVALWMGLRSRTARRARRARLAAAVAGPGARRALLAGGLVAAGALSVMAPWTAYVSDRAGSFVPVTRGSSSALFVGTYLPGNGTTLGMKRALAAEAGRHNPRLRGIPGGDLEAKAVLGVIADRHPELRFDAAVAREGRRNITRYGAGHPVRFAGMMLNKVQRMWSRYARGGARHTSPVIRVWHILLVLASLSGLAAGILRGRSLVLAAIALVVVYSTAVHMLVVSQARYNLPLMPALIAGGAAGWAMALGDRRRRRDPSARPLGAVRATERAAV